MAIKNMSRHEAEEHIKAGRSVGVYVDGVLRQVVKLEDLPSEAELAKGDPKREAQAEADLIKKQAEIEAQLVKLRAGQKGAVKTSKPKSGTKTPADDDGDPDPNAGQGTFGDEDDDDPAKNPPDANGTPPATP